MCVCGVICMCMLMLVLYECVFGVICVGMHNVCLCWVCVCVVCNMCMCMHVCILTIQFLTVISRYFTASVSDHQYLVSDQIISESIYLTFSRCQTFHA